MRLYHHRVEKQLTPAPSTESGIESKSSSTPSSVNEYTIRQLLEGVKDSGGKPVTIRIVTHERNGQVAEIDGVELYDIIRERPTPHSGLVTTVVGTYGRSS